MTVTTTNYQPILEAKRAELLAYLPGFKGGVVIEATAEPMEATVNMVSRGQRAEESRLAMDTLRLVNKALAKMKLGEFGFCEDCEEMISAKRLAAVPWCETCIGCAEERELRARFGAAVESAA